MATEFYHCSDCSKEWQDNEGAVACGCRCPDCNGKLEPFCPPSLGDADKPQAAALLGTKRILQRVQDYGLAHCVAVIPIAEIADENLRVLWSIARNASQNVLSYLEKMAK